ncbi:MAG: type III pantothenate kinase [Planctomycetota bacterium]
MADINLLAIDVGHARVKLGAFEAGELVESWRPDVSEPANVEGAIEQARERLEGHDAEVVIAASNASFSQEVEHLVKAAGWGGSQRVGLDVDLPIAVATDEPDRTGVDRVLNVAAAYEQLKKACVVVDAGTAITVDFCDDQGTFLGGCIAPGASLMAKALHQVAPQLPEVRPSFSADSYGKSTETAVNAGIVQALRGLVRESVERHAMTQAVWPEVIATGGEAFDLFGGDEPFELIHAVSRDLTLYGIALAYANHHIKHKT